MRRTTALVTLSLAICLSLTGWAIADKSPKTVAKVTPETARKMLDADPQHTFFIDIRTRPEYQLIGHPVGAYNIPFAFWTGKFSDKKYGRAPNPDFTKNISDRFDLAADTLIITCRSGKRSAKAVEALLKSGWPAERIFDMSEGFEGGKVKDKDSPHYGRRRVNGWRNACLPWTYDLDKKYLFKPDFPVDTAAKDEQ